MVVSRNLRSVVSLISFHEVRVTKPTATDEFFLDFDFNQMIDVFRKKILRLHC